jgi:arylsulfatase A
MASRLTRQPPERFPHGELPEGDEKPLRQAARWKNWKAVRLDPCARPERYDLENDIGETSDVAEQNPDTVKPIEAFLAAARTQSPHWPARIDGSS